MSDKPTEWMAKTVFNIYGHPNNPDGWQSVADAHNAAIAEERELSKERQAVIIELGEQLAAERKREDFDWGHVKREYLRLQKENANLEQQLAAVIEASEKLCKLYFEIAAEAIGEDAVRQKRDTALAVVRLEAAESVGK